MDFEKGSRNSVLKAANTICSNRLESKSSSVVIFNPIFLLNISY